MDRKIIDYIVISDDVIEDFQDTVKNSLQLGYVPYGSPMAGIGEKYLGSDFGEDGEWHAKHEKITCYTQAMVKYEPLPSETNG